MKKYAEGGIYTEDMGAPPQDIDGASVSPARKAPMKQPAMKRPPAKKVAPKRTPSGGIFREGMPVPQDIDGASVTPGPKKYAKGGFVRAADGIAKKGKTKGRMI